MQIFQKANRVVPEERVPEGSGSAPAENANGDGKGGLASSVAAKAAGAASTAAGAAATAANAAAGAAKDSQYFQAAQVAAGKAANAAKDALPEQAVQAANYAKEKVQDAEARAKERMARLWQQVREIIETYVKQKVHSVAEYVVDKLPGAVKDYLEDDDMPGCVKRGKDRAIDSLWPDVREEIMWEVAVLIDSQAQEDLEPSEPGPNCCRAFFRYHYKPYDKSFWKKLKDPWFVIFTGIPLVPVYAVPPLWFAFIFFMIDKSDEYQLIEYILNFKGMQFITLGVIRSIVGFLTFFFCVTAPASDRHKCEDSGPGSQPKWSYFTVIGMGCQVIFVWMAFVLLRYSKEKGRSTLKGHIEHEREGVATKGGYISYFLWYDLGAAFISVCIVCYALLSRPEPELDDWVVKHAVFLAQVVYGYFSFPFVLFTIPVLTRMLTHAMPTAYDSKGRCRKFAKPPRKEKGDETPKKAASVSDVEMNDLVSKLRSVVQKSAPMGETLSEA